MTNSAPTAQTLQRRVGGDAGLTSYLPGPFGVTAPNVVDLLAGHYSGSGLSSHQCRISPGCGIIKLTVLHLTDLRNHDVADGF